MVAGRFWHRSRQAAIETARLRLSMRYNHNLAQNYTSGLQDAVKKDRIMKNRLSAVCASVALMLFLGHSPSPVSAQELNAKELKKAVKEAPRAVSAGRYDEAMNLYDQVLASTSGTDPRRGEALYASVLLRIAGGAEHRDLAGARRHLDELEAFVPAPGRLEVPALRQLFDELDSARAEAERSAAALEAQAAAYQAEREAAAAEAEEAVDESEAAADGRVRSLESQLRKVRVELAECQEELETKEEALQKLRDALVGGS